MTKFEKKVLEAMIKIPKGRVATYKLLAESIGCPKAARAVGNAAGKNTELIKIPCHRVIRSDGKIGGYAAGTQKKMSLLRQEGIKIKNGKIDKSFQVNKL